MLGLVLLWALAPLSVFTQPTQSPAIRQIYEVDNDTAFENVAVRANGHLLITASNDPTLYSVDPHAPSPSLEVVFNFPNVSGCFGIQETTPDVFAVAVGNFSFTAIVKGSFGVWAVDFNEPQPAGKLLPMPEANGLNGMTRFHNHPHKVLISDSVLGAIWQLNVNTGQHDIVAQDPLFSQTSQAIPIGINGIRASDGAVYFTNSPSNIYGRAPFSAQGKAAGAAEVLAHAEPGTIGLDDFAISDKGDAWITAHPNALTVLPVGGGSERNVTGQGATQIVEPTSAVFGKGCDKDILYVVTAGPGMNDGLQGHAQVLAVDTTRV